MQNFILAIALILSVALCYGNLRNTEYSGITIRNKITDFSCFKEKNYTFILVRGYLNIGKPDPNAHATISAAKKYNFAAYVYINPCIACKYTPEEQIRQTIEALKGLSYSGIYVSVQLTDKWGSDTNSICNYIKKMITEIEKYASTSGIIFDKNSWDKIM